MKVPYIIMAPGYRHNSAGVRALYELKQHLENKGYVATILQGGTAPTNSIVVYPETVSGNPLNGKTIVRYVLNYPGLLGGDKQYNEKDIIFTYVTRFYPNVPVMTVPVIEDFFKNIKLPRSGGCFWVGKGEDVPRIPGIDGLTEITATWPETRKELAQLFNEKEIFYSYDDCTSLVAEARKCGCEAVVIPGEKSDISYDELIEDFDTQLDNFIRITQSATIPDIKFSFGCLCNDIGRLDMVLRQSQIDPEKYQIHTVKSPSSATKGLNQLLDLMDGKGTEVAILAHQDMFFRQNWLPQVQEQLSQLPSDWIVAGIIGKDMEGAIKGKFWDTRVPLQFDYGPLPCEASCFDEAVILVNLKSGFRFNEELTGFDLYGTMCVLQAQEMGGTAWIIDAFAEHYCLRPFTWVPDQLFQDNFKWLHQKYPDAKRIDSTVLGVPREMVEAERALIE